MVINVTSILLGQAGQTTGKVYNAGKVALIIFNLWLFGYLILMSNLYQGSIYSYLTVPVLPQTPRGVEDLLNWDVPIVAMDSVYSYPTKSYETYLKRYIIPEMISSGVHNEKVVEFLNKFQAKVLPMNDESMANTVSAILFGNSTKSQQIIILLYFEDILEQRVKEITIFLRNRRVVKNRGDSKFRTMKFDVGPNNLMAPYFAKEWRRMRETGLDQIWSKVYQIATFFRIHDRRLGGRKNFEAIQHLFWNRKDGVTFHEETPVSLKLVGPIFGFCAVIMASAMVEFLMECRKFIVQLVMPGVIYLRKMYQALMDFKFRKGRTAEVVRGNEGWKIKRCLENWLK